MVMSLVKPDNANSELPLIAINVLNKETFQKEPLMRADALVTLADVCCEEVFSDV